jgi:hypothetical protein
MRKQIFLKRKNQVEKSSWLEIAEDKIEITLLDENKIFTKTADNYFDALCQLRMELEQEGIILVCNGSSKDVYPSPMMLDMGDGDKAYRLKLGMPARMVDIVNIFDLEKERFIECTVKEQEDYYREWLDTKKMK